MRKRIWISVCLAIITAGCSPSPSNDHSKGEVEMSEHALISAAEKGDSKTVQGLLEQGVDIDQTDSNGRTAIMAATYAKHADMVRFLIEAGADIDIQDEMENNPFLYAGAEGMNDILLPLIEAGADTKLVNRYGGTALIPAAERGHVDTVKLLLEKTDVDVNHINRLGWTALIEAIILSDGGKAHQEIISILIEHGADVEIADKEGNTPMDLAKEKGYDDIINILQAAGA